MNNDFIERLRRPVGEATPTPQNIDYQAQQPVQDPSFLASKEREESLYAKIREDALLRNQRRFDEERRLYRQQVMQQREEMLSARQELQNVRQDALRGFDRSASARGMHGSGFDTLGRVQTMAQLGQSISDVERAGASSLGALETNFRGARDAYSEGQRQAELDYATQMTQSDARFQEEREKMGIAIMELMNELVSTGRRSMFEQLLLAKGLDLRALSDGQRAALAKTMGDNRYLDPNYVPLYGELQGEQPDGGSSNPMIGNRDSLVAMDSMSQATGQKWDIDGKTKFLGMGTDKGANQVTAITDTMSNVVEKTLGGKISKELQKLIESYSAYGSTGEKPTQTLVAGINKLIESGDEGAITIYNEMRRLDFDPLDGQDRPFKVKGKGIIGDLSFNNPYQLETYLESIYDYGENADRLEIKVKPPVHLGQSAAGNLRVYFVDKVTGKEYSTYKKFQENTK